jgi:iodotyrosine deiodinase
LLQPRLVSLPGYRELPLEEMRRRAGWFLETMRGRRTVRDFSGRPVPRDIIESCILTAGSAPSGVNKQPWRFVAVADPELKRRIRKAAEEEERAFYAQRAPQEWLDALAELGTDASKPFLEVAPWLIVIFAETRERRPDGTSAKNYYVNESVGIATGLLIAALHHAGLVSLTHTPSPMRFLNDLLGRPEHERPFLILVTGFPGDHARVPHITKKGIDEIARFVE